MERQWLKEIKRYGGEEEERLTSVTPMPVQV